jgi:hypothetical protein
VTKRPFHEIIVVSGTSSLHSDTLSATELHRALQTVLRNQQLTSRERFDIHAAAQCGVYFM